MMQPVIFDVDGVLVDSEPLYEQHMNLFLKRHGVKNPNVRKLNLKGVSARDTSKILLEKYNLDYSIDKLIEVNRGAYLDHLESIDNLPTIPGVVEFIEQLSKNGSPLAVASSASAHRIDLFLSKLDIKNYFKAMVCGDDVKNSKPAPDIFILAAEKLHVRPADCIVIEDAYNGVQAAKNAGMYCVAFGGSDHNDDDLSAADIVVNDFNVLTKLLKSAA